MVYMTLIRNLCLMKDMAWTLATLMVLMKVAVPTVSCWVMESVTRLQTRSDVSMMEGTAATQIEMRSTVRIAAAKLPVRQVYCKCLKLNMCSYVIGLLQLTGLS